MYGLMMSTKAFSLDDPEEDMAALDLRMKSGKTDQNENTMRKRYTDLGESGGLYRQKFNNKRKAQDETGSETNSGAITPPGGAASKGPVPWCGVVPPGTVSYSFLSRCFSYLIKTTKV
jgi:hypothetical protein